MREGAFAVVDREGVAVRKPGGAVVEWHSSGDWTLHAVEEDGRLVLWGGTSVLVLGQTASDPTTEADDNG